MITPALHSTRLSKLRRARPPLAGALLSGGNVAYQVGKQAREVQARRQRIYDFICASWHENGYAPSHQEIADAVGVGTTAVNRHLQVLRARGCIDWTPDTPRTIRVTGKFR